MTRRMHNQLNNGLDRDGFTLGVTLDWSHVFLGLCGLGLAAVIFFAGLAYGAAIICDP